MLEELFLPVMMVLFYLIIFFDLNRIHDLIVDIDLRPSMTQFLIVAIFTPIALMTMNYYTQQENLYTIIVDNSNIENIRYANLKNKYTAIEILIENAKKDSNFCEANPKFAADRFDNNVESLIKALTEYQEVFNMNYIGNDSMIFASINTPFNFDLYHLNIVFLRQVTNVFRTEYQYKYFSTYLGSFEESYKKIEFKKIEDLHKILQEKEQLSLRYIRSIQALYFALAAFMSYIFFRLMLLFLKFYYIEKILLNKLEKINSIDTWTSSEQNIILEMKKVFFHLECLNSSSLYQAIKFKLNLLKFDKALSKIIDSGNIKIAESRCAKLLNI